MTPDDITSYRWIYESNYYRNLLERANLTSPTALTSAGERIELQHTCINRAMLPCQLIMSHLAPNLETRTEGQLRLTVNSSTERELTPEETPELIRITKTRHHAGLDEDNPEMQKESLVHHAGP